MRSLKFSQPAARDENMGVKLPAELKAQVFALAARQNLPASHIVREALTAFVNQQLAA